MCVCVCVVLVGKRTDTVRDHFAHELTPYPSSLFKDCFMRKPDKPALYCDILTGFTAEPLPSDVQYVVDGGYMLHKVRWQASSDLCIILPLYLKFLPV